MEKKKQLIAQFSTSLHTDEAHNMGSAVCCSPTQAHSENLCWKVMSASYKILSASYINTKWHYIIRNKDHLSNHSKWKGGWEAAIRFYSLPPELKSCWLSSSMLLGSKHSIRLYKVSQICGLGRLVEFIL